MHVCLLEAGEKDTRHDKNHMSGSAVRQGDTPALSTSEAVGRVIGENGKKLGLDSATTANKDSVKEKVKEKAVEKALDFLKKKIK